MPTTTSGKRVPARIHVLLARDAKVGLVLRVGPARRVCVLGWDREDDTLELGQWLAARIYAHRSDIAPDGKHWIYFALNGRWQSETRGSYSALARVPYLKALALWPQGDTWGGGGLFLDRDHFHVAGAPHHVGRGAAPITSGPSLVDQTWYRGDKHGSRLVRDGWRALGSENLSADHHLDRFERALQGGWSLVKEVHYTSRPRRPGKGVPYEEHRLVSAASERDLALPDWEWADVDGGRLVWAERGCLMAGRVTREDGLGDVRVLHDLNDMTFARRRAPY